MRSKTKQSVPKDHVLNQNSVKLPKCWLCWLLCLLLIFFVSLEWRDFFFFFLISFCIYWFDGYLCLDTVPSSESSIILVFGGFLLLRYHKFMFLTSSSLMYILPEQLSLLLFHNLYRSVVKATAPGKIFSAQTWDRSHGPISLALFITYWSFWILVPCVPQGLNLVISARIWFRSHTYILF